MNISELNVEIYNLDERISKLKDQREKLDEKRKNLLLESHKIVYRERCVVTSERSGKQCPSRYNKKRKQKGYFINGYYYCGNHMKQIRINILDPNVHTTHDNGRKRKLDDIFTEVNISNLDQQIDKDNEDGSQKRQRLNDDKKAINTMISTVRDELLALERFIQSPVSDGLKRIEEKVDQISLSPDCPEGRKMMEVVS